jgi:chromate reductase
MAGNHALRQSFVYVDMIPMQQPEIYLAKVDTLFDEQGQMVDRTRNFLQRGVLAFVDHVKLIQS